MGTRQHLSRAPIVEALIQINVDLPPDTDLEPVVRAHERIKEAFPISRQKFRSQIKFGVSPVAQASVPAVAGLPPTVVGYMFFNQEETRVVQFAVDSFSFNWLKPYQNWNVFRDFARSMWKIYVEALKPRTVKRIGLRYINDLAVPLPIRDFNQVLAAPPIVPEGLPQAVTSYFDRVVIEDVARRAGAIIMRTIEGQPKENHLPLILDIDVFRDAALDPEAEEVWDTLEILREFKNDVFFTSITDELEKLYI